MKITALQVRSSALPGTPARIPLNRPTHRAATNELVAVELQTDEGIVGQGYTLTSSCSGTTLQMLVEKELFPWIADEDPRFPERIFSRVRERCRAIGWTGIMPRAFAAIDIALWDIRSRSRGLPLFQDLGGYRSSSPGYLSMATGTNWEASEVLEQARSFLDAGGIGIRVEVGSENVEQDAHRLEQLYEMLGHDRWFGVSAAGRYDLSTASALAMFFQDEVAVDWFDEPIAAHDALGYRRLAERTDTPLAIGSTFDSLQDFRAVLEAGDVRVLRPDLYRMGGITPVVHLSTIASVYPVTLAPIGPPEVLLHLGCGLPNIPVVDCYSPFPRKPFRLVKGELEPVAEPGIQLELPLA